jgi:tRNA pseudouridine65 synthase
MHDIFALLITDSNGYIYLSRTIENKPALFFCSKSGYSQELAAMGFSIIESCPLIAGEFTQTKAVVKTIETAPPTGSLPSDIICLTVPDAIKMIDNGHIDDILTIAALLKAEYSKLVKRRVEVLYQDEYCIAVNKPHGLLVHRTNMSSDKEFLLQRLRDQCGRKVYPVHRLDRPTSGIVLFAFTKEIVAEFFRVFREREVKKTYLALVRGWTEDSGIIDSPLKTSGGNEQDALTLYKTLERFELPIPVRPYDQSRYSLVEIDLKTGRTHQIRRHFAHLRHPLVGDTTYGDGRHNMMFREKFSSHRLLLAAVKLQMLHPITNMELSISAPLETGFQTLLEKIRLQNSII